MSAPTDFLTYAQAAAHYNVSTRTLSALVAEGQLTRRHSVRDGRIVLLARQELDRFFSLETVTTPRVA